MLLVVGLGTNLGERHENLERAAAALAARYTWRAGSRLYSSTPIGPPQGDFLNAAVLIEAAEHPLQVLARCQLLEARAGRDRDREGYWGARVLDLDLLLADTVVVAAPGLTLPHPHLHLRRFALLPAAELVPDWVHPRLHRSLADLAADPALADQACEPAGPTLRPDGR